MKYNILAGHENYTAVVAKVINTFPHPKADKLQFAMVCGSAVITDLSTKIGDTVLYFSLESQISDAFLSANDLYRRKDEDGNMAGGFFEQNRRVKAVKLRGEYSNGFIMPIGCMAKLGFDPEKFNVGDQFNEIDSIEICRKYFRKTKQINEPSQRTKGKVKRESKVIDTQFRFHYSTPQMRRCIDNFGLNDLITVTSKIHGTSGIFANVLCKKPIGWLSKLVKKLVFDVVDKEYSNVYASRTVIKNPDINPSQNGFYGPECIWGIVNEEIKEKIRPTITLYVEIYGQLPNGKWIQSGYRYGTGEGQHSFAVYRITSTTTEGDVIEFSWDQIVEYCTNYGLPVVPVFYYGTVKQFFLENEVNFTNTEQAVGQLLVDKLSQLFLEKDLVEGVPDEGVCVRNNSRGGFAFKLKSLKFLGHESKMLDDDSSVDMEAEQEVEE